MRLPFESFTLAVPTALTDALTRQLFKLKSVIGHYYNPSEGTIMVFKAVDDDLEQKVRDYLAVLEDQAAREEQPFRISASISAVIGAGARCRKI